MKKAYLIIRHEVLEFFKYKANLFYLLIVILLGFLSEHIELGIYVGGKASPELFPKIIIHRYAFYVILSFFVIHLASQSISSIRREWDSNSIYYSLLTVNKKHYYFFSNLFGQVLTHSLFVLIGSFTLILIYIPSGVVFGNFLATPLLLLPFVCFLIFFVNYLFYSGLEKNAGIATFILYIGFLAFSIKRYKYMTLFLPDVFGIQKTIVKFAFDGEIDFVNILIANYQVIIYALILLILIYRKVNKMEIVT